MSRSQGVVYPAAASFGGFAVPAHSFRKIFLFLMTALLFVSAVPVFAHEATLGGSKWCFGENRILAAIELGASLFPEIRGVKEGGYDLNSLSDQQLKKLTTETIEPYIARRLSVSVNEKVQQVKVTKVALEGSLWRIWLSVGDIAFSKPENRVKIEYKLLFEETNNAHLNIAYMYQSEAEADAVQKVFDYSQPVAQHSFGSNSRVWELSIKGAANGPVPASGQASPTPEVNSNGSGQGNALSASARKNNAVATTAVGKALDRLPADSPKSVGPSGDTAEITPSRQTSGTATATGEVQTAGPGNSLVLNNPVKKSVWAGISEFITLGVKHILIGYDHIAFLVALIVIGLSVREVLKIITAFTIAHSITLLLAALQIVRLNSRLVETVIALSICYVALENLFKKEVNYRWLLTFGFGLIHGFGFASVLQDFIVGKSNLVLSVLSFNIGVEIGQLMIFMALLPILHLLKSRAQFRRVTVGVSVAIFMLGLSWFIERAFNL